MIQLPKHFWVVSNEAVLLIQRLWLCSETSPLLCLCTQCTLPRYSLEGWGSPPITNLGGPQRKEWEGILYFTGRSPYGNRTTLCSSCAHKMVSGGFKFLLDSSCCWSQFLLSLLIYQLLEPGINLKWPMTTFTCKRNSFQVWPMVPSPVKISHYV